MGQVPNPMVNLIPLVLILFIFYFLIMRPQKKAQDEHKKMLSQLKKNDEVTTSGGIYGTVVNVKDDTVTLRVDDDVKIEVLKSAIGTVRRKASE
jgi:preprotein translocase subunit YajC